MAFHEDLMPIIRVASICQLPDLLSQCIQRLSVSALDIRYLEKELPGDTCGKIKEIRRSTFPDDSDVVILNPEHENTVRNIHKALDSDHVDLVGRLLKDSAVTLDDAFAIHYAAAYCKPKVLAELLKLDSVYLNLKNKSGYTPLHMACMRQEPDIIVLLVDRGASVLERTPDGRDALTICKRLTREKDYNKKLEKYQERNKPCLCIDILEEVKRKSFTQDSTSLEETILTPLLVDNFYTRLLNLEIRVGFAKIFFRSEARLAMRIAEADSTEEFTGTSFSKLKEFGLNRRLRLDALTKTVKLGRRYFPNCSAALDKFVDEESTDLAFLESGTPEEKRIKTTRFYELKEEMRKAFHKDIAAGAAITSTTSSSSFPRLEILTPGNSSSLPAGAADSTDALPLPFCLSSQAPSAGTAAGLLESQGSGVVVDEKIGVGSKRKLKSAVWDEFERVKRGNDWKAKCMWCDKFLSACTKNGTRHLHHHLKICRSRQETKDLKRSTMKLSQNSLDITVTL